MIETEIDPTNEEVIKIAKNFIGCEKPLKCIFKWVSSNIGDAPNVFTSIVNALGNMGWPYVAFTAEVGKRTWNEIYDYEEETHHIANLADNVFAENITPDYNPGVRKYNESGDVKQIKV